MIGAKKQDSAKYNRASVMTPLNWMCGICEGILLPTAAHSYSNWIGIAFFILSFLILIFYACMYFHFAKSDPDRLQSEEYNLESQRLAFAYDEHKGIIADESNTQFAIASPFENSEAEFNK